MSFHIISKCVEDHTNNVDAKQQQPNPTSPVSLKSDLMALGFSGPEIDELLGAENADRDELSLRLQQVLELQRSIQQQEQHAQTVLRADSVLRTAEYQLFGKKDFVLYMPRLCRVNMRLCT